MRSGYNARRWNYAEWPRGIRKPNSGVKWLVDRCHVSTPHWRLFQEEMGHRLSKLPARDVFYVWIQTYNRHEANRREYKWVMGGFR